MNIRLTVLFGALLAGCGGPDTVAACEGYIDAYITCVDEAYADDETTAQSLRDATATTCDAYDGAGTDEASDYFDCLNDAYAAGDCSTTEGFTAIDISGCTIAG